SAQSEQIVVWEACLANSSVAFREAASREAMTTLFDDPTVAGTSPSRMKRIETNKCIDKNFIVE
ncbi:MAG: hypothetical protein ABI076_06320, partial [Acidobacteriaceae bacterium]